MLRRAIVAFAVVLALIPVAAIAAIIVFAIFFKTYSTPSGSLQPTLAIGDVVLVDKLEDVGSANDGDVAVFVPPIDSPNPFIKRMIASPGDRLKIVRGVVYRNGSVIRESYITAPADYDFEVSGYAFRVDGVPLDGSMANMPPRAEWASPDTVPSNCYIVLGDNRNNSEDSHFFGCAQSNGSFWSGLAKGEPAGFKWRAISIVWPRAHSRNL